MMPELDMDMFDTQMPPAPEMPHIQGGEDAPPQAGNVPDPPPLPDMDMAADQLPADNMPADQIPVDGLLPDQGATW